MGMSRKQGRRLGLALAVGAAAIILGVASAMAEPPVLSQFCPDGSGQGQCNIPRGVATNPTTGDIYVADQSNARIQKFTAWGEFLGNWGSEGSGEGEFNLPQGVAIDSGGDVYVVDYGNHRVQKFDSEGNFISMFGGEVDKTTNANVCTAASGDVCGPGVEGSADGFFDALALPGSYIAVGPGDKIYVGDQKRIQVFNTSGVFQESIKSTALEEGGTVQSLAIDSSDGDIYVTFASENPLKSKPAVRKLSPTGELLASLQASNPWAITVDASNGDVFVQNRVTTTGSQSELKKFNASGEQVESFDSTAVYDATGLATNSPPTCGIEGTDLIASNSRTGHSFVRIYGPPLDPSECPPEKVAPAVDDQFASAVNASSATVKARINPHFWTKTTRYFVEYGTGKCSEGGCTAKQPTPPGTSLAGDVTNSDVTTSGVLLAGLAADTTYHYRFVATSEGGGPTTGGEASFHTLPLASERGVDSCPNAAFRIGASANLPDCRAYEMVSPVDKNGGDIFTNTLQSYKQEKSEFAVADETGQRMIFSSLRAFSEAEGAPFGNQYLATRVEGSGWSTKAISPPRNTVSFYPVGGSATLNTYKLFSEDLCSGWLLQDSPVALAPGAPDQTGTLYRRDLCSGGFEASSSVAPPNFPFKPLNSLYYPEVQGASADSANTVFRADDALTSGACSTAGIFQVYETLGGGQLQLVSVLPSGSSAAGLPSCEQSSAGTAQGSTGEFREDSTAGAVSKDGERIYWTTGGTEPYNPAVTNDGQGDQPGAIYLRDNAREEESKHNGSGKCTQGTKACTYEVSGLASGTERARFLAGSADGARAFFTIGFTGSEELYEFEATEEKNGLSTVATRLAKGFEGFMGASKDGRRAYFVSTETQPAWGGGTAGQDNLYFYEKGGDPRFVTELSGLDVFGNSVLSSSLPSPVSPVPLQRTSRVSPDGLHAAFLSTASLTGFDNTDAESGEPDAEAYLYDASADGGQGKLVCASCNATGARPAGRQIAFNGNEESVKLRAAAVIPGWSSQTRGSRVLSDNGKRLFFTSFDPLVLRDTNGRADVYEWQAVSSREECLSPPMQGELFLSESSGCISLISSGQSPQDTELIDATPEGKDVFFATSSSLVPQDPGLVDVYDARVDGGFAPPPTPKASCEGESCQSPPPPPNTQTPSSAIYSGPENLKETKPKGCPKGKVKKQGKCVKKKAKKKSNNKSHKKKGKAKKSGRAAR